MRTRRTAVALLLSILAASACMGKPAFAQDASPQAISASPIDASKSVSVLVWGTESLSLDRQQVEDKVCQMLSTAGIKAVRYRETDASKPVTRLTIAVVALNTLHFPPGVVHYGLVVSEGRELPPSVKPAQIKAMKLLNFEEKGIARKEVIAREAPEKIYEMVRQFIRGYSPPTATLSKPSAP